MKPWMPSVVRQNNAENSFMNQPTTIRRGRNRLSTVIDFTILGAFLYYLFFIWHKYPLSVGGSLIFFTPISFMFYLSFVHKKFHLEFSLFSLIIFSLMCLNFIAYIEHIQGLSNSVLAGTVICQVTIVVCVVRLIRMSFEVDKPGSTPVRKALDTRVSRYLASRLAFSLAFVVITGAILKGIGDDNFQKNNILQLLNFSTLSLVWLNIGLLLVLTMKRQVVACAIKKLVVNKEEWRITSIRNKFIFSAAALFVAGSFFEIMRGLWIMWFCSWIALLLTAVTIWRVWRYTFTKEKSETAVEIREEMIQELPSLEDFSYVLKFVGIGTVISGFYLFLILMWAYWGR
jgi:hypothetical protein